jgi:precorrin-6A/cobalt-precorrin-6A reductase
MRVKLLILGGTSEASALARAVARRGINAVISYAGRVERPRDLPIPRRVGGFGGAAGLADYLRANAITHVVDATHPFAAQMSQNAVEACAQSGVPLVALTRPAWTPGRGDDWREVPDIASAVAALDGPPRRVMLAIGRMHLTAFAAQPQHDYLLRLVDPPETPPPLPRHSIVVSRGPFTVEGDNALLREHGIEMLVAKNAGGSGARAKLDAARALGLPVIMITRPPLPKRREVATPDAVLYWLGHAGTDLGV